MIKNVQNFLGLRFQLISISVIRNLGIKTEFIESGSNLIRKSDENLIDTVSVMNSGSYKLMCFKKKILVWPQA